MSDSSLSLFDSIQIEEIEPIPAQKCSPEEEIYGGTSLVRNRAPLGPCSRTLPRALFWSCGEGLFLMCEVPLYRPRRRDTDTGDSTMCFQLGLGVCSVSMETS